MEILTPLALFKHQLPLFELFICDARALFIKCIAYPASTPIFRYHLMFQINNKFAHGGDCDPTVAATDALADALISRAKVVAGGSAPDGLDLVSRDNYPVSANGCPYRSRMHSQPTFHR